jgi:hypothetical protein
MWRGTSSLSWRYRRRSSFRLGLGRFGVNIEPSIFVTATTIFVPTTTIC